MSIFGSIMSKIFGGGGAQAAPATSQATGGGSSAAAAPASGGGAASSTGAGGAQGNVDVEAILNDMSAKSGQTLNWRQSIVDLMKLLGLDSSLQARKELAKELHYTGDTSDSAAMNVWLHKQVMQKLAANGGKVPDDLKS